MSEDKLSDKEFEQALLLRKLEFEVRDLESRWRASGRAMKVMLQAIAVLGGISTVVALVVSIGDLNAQAKEALAQREDEVAQRRAEVEQRSHEVEQRNLEVEQRRREAFIRYFGELSQVPGELDSLPRVRFLLLSLRSIVDEARDDGTRRGDEAMVTGQLAFIATSELDFIASRIAADLDGTFAELWPAYDSHFAGNVGDNRVLLYKLFQGLRHLAARDPKYFRAIRWEGEYRVTRYTEEALFRHFASLSGAYRRHWQLLAAAGGERREYALRFAEALGNPALAADLFGGDAADYRAAIDETPSAGIEAP
ncbi:MAG: hypothetical protein KC486_18745 [Myxococcales bacterium]|nr:hypothetical protein [Myxococcales bacterium]